MTVSGSRRILAPMRRVSVALRHPRTLSGAPAVTGAAPLVDAQDDAHVAWTVTHGRLAFAMYPDGDETELAYDGEGSDETALKAEAESLLNGLQAEIAGPRETGAEGPLLATANAAQSVMQLRAMPSMIFGFPLIFWIGTAIFLFIFFMMFSAYL